MKRIADTLGVARSNLAAASQPTRQRRGRPPQPESELVAESASARSQKNKITRCCARRDTRPSAPHDERTRSAYIFGAICPSPAPRRAWCCRAAIPQRWRCTGGNLPSGGAWCPCRAAPRSGRLASLRQASCPRQHHPDAAAAEIGELNPAEDIWRYMRDNWLSNRIFRSYEESLDQSAANWRRGYVCFLVSGPVWVGWIGAAAVAR